MLAWVSLLQQFAVGQGIALLITLWFNKTDATTKQYCSLDCFFLGKTVVQGTTVNPSSCKWKYISTYHGWKGRKLIPALLQYPSYLGDGKHVYSPFLFLQVIHKHWCTHKQHVCHRIPVNVHWTHHTAKVGAKLKSVVKESCLYVGFVKHNVLASDSEN